MKNLSRPLSTFYYLALLATFLIIASNLHAQKANAEEPTQSQPAKFIDILPAITTAEDPYAPLPSQTTHSAVRLTPDKSEIIKLEKDASSIIVGNPAHLSVLADSPRTLVLVPKAVGATHFTVLDKKGNIIMQRHVIAAAPTDNYIRIKKTCADDSDGCEETSIYYCPDTCHEIKPYKEEK